MSVTQSHFISHFGGGCIVLVPGTATFVFFVVCTLRKTILCKDAHETLHARSQKFLRILSKNFLPYRALAGKPPAPHSHTGLCLRYKLSLFAGRGRKSKHEYSGCEFSDLSLDCIPYIHPYVSKCNGFTCRQTPHMSIPTPQVPPLPIEVPQPAPPGFLWI